MLFLIHSITLPLNPKDPSSVQMITLAICSNSSTCTISSFDLAPYTRVGLIPNLLNSFARPTSGAIPIPPPTKRGFLLLQILKNYQKVLLLMVKKHFLQLLLSNH